VGDPLPGRGEYHPGRLGPDKDRGNKILKCLRKGFEPGFLGASRNSLPGGLKGSLTPPFPDLAVSNLNLNPSGTMLDSGKKMEKFRLWSMGRESVRDWRRGDGPPPSWCLVVLALFLHRGRVLGQTDQRPQVPKIVPKYLNHGRVFMLPFKLQIFAHPLPLCPLLIYFALGLPASSGVLRNIRDRVSVFEEVQVISPSKSYS